METTKYILKGKDRNGNTTMAWELDTYEKALEKVNYNRSREVFNGLTFTLEKVTTTYESIEI